MACPYFVPREILNDGSWLHPARLPLGAGFTGHCCAADEIKTPSDSDLHQFCNLGNATTCPQLPPRRDWDAVRFSVARANLNRIVLCYVCELAYAPIEHGKLTFCRAENRWITPHADLRVQRLAECFLKTYRARQNEIQIIAEGATA